jgi:type VI protein secretion system component VasK
MLVEYLWYALIGLLAFVAILVLSIRSERARREAEAKMTPEQREVERREREAFRRMGSGD